MRKLNKSKMGWVKTMGFVTSDFLVGLVGTDYFAKNRRQKPGVIDYRLLIVL